METAEKKAYDESRAIWKLAALALGEAKEAYRRAHAIAWLANANLKPVESRKAQTDLDTTDLRTKRELALVEERACYHDMIKLRGSAGEPEVYERQPAERGAA